MYDPNTHPKQAEKLAQLGATDEEIAAFFEISARTLYRWRNEHEEFCQALKSGKDPADDRVERSLYERATGFRYVEQQAIKIKVGKDQEEVVVVDVEKMQIADTTAGIFWLKNRRKDLWRDVQRIANTDTDGNDAPQDPVPVLEQLLSAARQRRDADGSDLA